MRSSFTDQGFQDPSQGIYPTLDLNFDLNEVLKYQSQPVLNMSSHPFNSIGRLESKLIFKKGVKTEIVKHSTGCIIGSKHILASTEAIFFQDYKLYADQVYFYPVSKKNNILSKQGIQVIQCNLKNETQFFKSEKDLQSKIVILQLKETNLIEDDQIVKLNFNFNMRKQQLHNVILAGLSEDSQSEGNAQFYEKKKIFQQNDQVLYYNKSQQNRKKGTPVLMQVQNGRFQLIGIHNPILKNQQFTSQCLLLQYLKPDKQFILNFINRQAFPEGWQKRKINAQNEQHPEIENLRGQLRFKQDKIKDMQNQIQQMKRENQKNYFRKKVSNMINHNMILHDKIPQFQKELIHFKQHLHTLNHGMIKAHEMLQNQNNFEQVEKIYLNLKEQRESEQIERRQHVNQTNLQKIRQQLKLLVSPEQYLGIAFKSKFLWFDTTSQYKIQQRFTLIPTETKQKYNKFNKIYLSDKGKLLSHQSYPINMELFTKCNWQNLEFLNLASCQIDSRKWRLLASKAQYFVSLKVLLIERNQIEEVRQKDLNNFIFLKHLSFSDIIRGSNPLNEDSSAIIKSFSVSNPHIMVTIISSFGYY